MTAKIKPKTKRVRFSVQERHAQLLEAAVKLIFSEGLPALSMRGLARSAGVSKALIYHHFPTQTALLNAVVRRELETLRPALAELPRIADDEQAALAATRAYLERIMLSGGILQLLLSDQAFARQLEDDVRAFRDGAVRRLALRLRRSAGLSRRDAIIAVDMLIAIVEQAGRLVFEKQLEPAMARRICELHISTGLKSFAEHMDAVRTSDVLAAGGFVFEPYQKRTGAG